jgi:hypothetical protein
MPVRDYAHVFAAAVGADDDSFDLDTCWLELDRQIVGWTLLGHTLAVER